MNSGWEVRPLGEECEITMGTSPPGDTYNTTGNGTPLINGPVEFGPGAFGLTVKTKFTTAPNKMCRKGDLILCVRGSTTGKTNIADFDACVGRGVAAVRAKQFQPWVNYFIHWKTSAIFALGTGSTFPNITAPALAAIPIPVPPLPEQRRIVAILDEAFEGIAAAKANAERNWDSARDVFESQRERLLSGSENGWDEKLIDELCEIKHGFAFESKYFTEDGEHICLTPGNFFEDGGYRDRCDKTKYYSGPIPKGFILSAGQMLVAMTEQAPGLLGSPAIVPEGQRFLHNQRLGLICPKEGTPWVNDFFFHVFNRPSFRKAVHRTATGVKVRHTSPSKLRQISVSFPASECDQRKAAAGISKLQQEVECHQEISRRKICALADLKASLLHQAFTGQL